MKGSCSAVSKLLEKYFDQEVTDEERSLVEAHLLDCHACQDVLKSMEKVRDVVKAPVEEAVEKEDFPWLWQKIERRIRSEKKPTFWETLRSWLQISPPFQRKVWIPAVAAAAIILVITIPLLFKKTPSYPSPSVVEYVESQTHNVMVYESENAKVTVIWLFEEPEKEAPSS
jgi:anti-sigma factor RsiW